MATHGAVADRDPMSMMNQSVGSAPASPSLAASPPSRSRSASNTTPLHASAPPPSKKQRPSPSPSPTPSPASPSSSSAAAGICVGARASATSNYKPKHHNPGAYPPHNPSLSAAAQNTPTMQLSDHGSDDHQRGGAPCAAPAPAEAHARDGRASPSSRPTPATAAATAAPTVADLVIDASSEQALTEDSFLSWLLDQKSQGVGASQMLDVLGLGVSDGIAVDDDELWEAMISMGIRLIQPSIPARNKLTHVNTLQDVVQLLRTSKKIVVLAGAGLSVSCGIPDFRSENGIYNRLGEYNLPNPQCMFDIDFFRSNPRPFFAFAKELFPKSKGFTFVPSPSHYFLKLLEDRGQLLRIYSQNIDMLERAAGISHERSILCHGSFETATCLACKKVYPSEAIREDVMKQQVPMCTVCHAEDGIIKPDIVFFGESLPRRFHDSIKNDEDEADLVLVMGSSLKVNPVRSLVGRIRKDTPMVLINREPVGRPHKFDVELLGYSDEIVQELCRQLGWELPRPDPVLLSQSNLPESVLQTPRTTPTAPLDFEFVPPCRHLFNGSKANSSSSDEDDDEDDRSSSSSSPSARQEHMPMEEDIDIANEAEALGADHRLGLPSSQSDDHYMVTGNAAHQVEILLGNDSFETLDTDSDMMHRHQ